MNLKPGVFLTESSTLCERTSGLRLPLPDCSAPSPSSGLLLTLSFSPSAVSSNVTCLVSSFSGAEGVMTEIDGPCVEGVTTEMDGPCVEGVITEMDAPCVEGVTTEMDGPCVEGVIIEMDAPCVDGVNSLTVASPASVLPSFLLVCDALVETCS